MKLFVADKHIKGNFGKKGYHWCDDGDLLMFGLFQLGNGNPSAISMCGINHRKFTTFIKIQDVKISKDFYRELLTNSLEEAMNCKVDENGDFGVEIGWDFKFNIYDIMNELLDKASEFEDGQKVKCFGRKLTSL